MQPIRDDYTALRSLKLQYVEGEALFTLLQKQLEEQNTAFDNACKIAVQAAEKQDKINAEYIKAQPLITEAAQLEKQLANDSKSYKEQTEEIKRLANERSKNLETISNCKKELAALAKECDEKNAWFEAYAAYSEAIPMIPSIVANIKFIDNEKISVRLKKETLAQALNLSKNTEKQLATARLSEEALKQTMSSEIALLRKRLVEGEPCPVCGSKHHEIVEIATNLLEEKQLEKAKEDNRLLIEHLEKSLSNSKIEIETLHAAIAQHNNTISQYQKANLDYLAGIDNAGELLENKDATKILKELADNWSKYKERLVAIGNESALCKNKQSHHQTRLEEIEKELHTKNEKNNHLKEEIEKCQERIKLILGQWNSVNEAQQYYNQSIAEANKTFATATEQKGRTDIERNRLKGQITEKEKQQADAAAKIEHLTQKVTEYLLAREDNLEITTLAELLSTDHAVINTMRTSIDTLEKAVTTATATLLERRQNLTAHNEATNRPSENEDVNYIHSEVSALEKASQEINENIIHINAQLLKDEKSRLEFSQYSEEYEEKRLQMTHWNTLCNMFGSSNGSVLMKLAQGYTLDILLEVANVHLSEMTKRYKLARIADDNLGIKVIDLDMMSECRSAHTLSGGETFIVSLALSLALSSLSSSNMSIESLFIDEGFGALDKETLQTALMVLEKLQSRGRKIGVISHLTEMLEQIPVKINVKKISPGKSKIEITENYK